MRIVHFLIFATVSRYENEPSLFPVPRCKTSVEEYLRGQGRYRHLFEPMDKDEAMTSYNRAVELKPNDGDAWFNRGVAYFGQLLIFLLQRQDDLARHAWMEALSSGKRSNHEKWPTVVSEILLSLAQTGQLDLVRQLITEAQMEEQLFLLARAIEYLQSGDEALIEKLSPEVKGIVEEVVAKLRPASKGKRRTKRRNGETEKRREKQ